MQTKRLLLRDFRSTDIDQIHEYAADVEVSRPTITVGSQSGHFPTQKVGISLDGGVSDAQIRNCPVIGNSQQTVAVLAVGAEVSVQDCPGYTAPA